MEVYVQIENSGHWQYFALTFRLGYSDWTERKKAVDCFRRGRTDAGFYFCCWRCLPVCRIARCLPDHHFAAPRDRPFSAYAHLLCDDLETLGILWQAASQSTPARVLLQLLRAYVSDLSFGGVGWFDGRRLCTYLLCLGQPVQRPGTRAGLSIRPLPK